MLNKIPKVTFHYIDLLMIHHLTRPVGYTLSVCWGMNSITWTIILYGSPPHSCIVDNLIYHKCFDNLVHRFHPSISFWSLLASFHVWKECNINHEHKSQICYALLRSIQIYYSFQKYIVNCCTCIQVWFHYCLSFLRVVVEHCLCQTIYNKWHINSQK